MDPIPVIDLNEYDLSYELQFTTFMITLLEPYIRFDRNSEAPEIYRKGCESQNPGVQIFTEHDLGIPLGSMGIDETWPAEEIDHVIQGKKNDEIKAL